MVACGGRRSWWWGTVGDIIGCAVKWKIKWAVVEVGEVIGSGMQFEKVLWFCVMRKGISGWI